jgi:calcineurin-like phosphoesterase family protein
MKDIWFTADTHFYHKNIIKYCNRPFKTLEEMHETLIANWNSLVKPEDIIFVLGDFCFGSGKKVKELTAQLNGEKFLILGNHDSVKVGRKDSGFIDIMKSCPIAYKPYDAHPGWLANMDHYPWHDNRNELGSGFNAGKWLLHGHVHNLWKVCGGQINVGVDVWNYKPVHINLISNIISPNDEIIQAMLQR